MSRLLSPKTKGKFSMVRFYSQYLEKKIPFTYTLDISALFSLKRCLCIKNDETLLVMFPPKIEVFSQTTGIYVEIIYNHRVRNLTVKKRKKKKGKKEKEKERK